MIEIDNEEEVAESALTSEQASEGFTMESPSDSHVSLSEEIPTVSAPILSSYRSESYNTSLPGPSFGSNSSDLNSYEGLDSLI